MTSEAIESPKIHSAKLGEPSIRMTGQFRKPTVVLEQQPSAAARQSSESVIVDAMH